MTLINLLFLFYDWYGDLLLFTQLQITQLKQQCPNIIDYDLEYCKRCLNVLKMMYYC